MSAQLTAHEVTRPEDETLGIEVTGNHIQFLNTVMIVIAIGDASVECYKHHLVARLWPSGKHFGAKPRNLRL